LQTMKGTFVICKRIFALAIGLICSTEKNNKIKYATDVLQWLTTGMVHTRANQKET